ncbi:MAG: hypothetical protein JRH05_07500 [Deltaproteobacteria bacterium]|nr:hypothetical protein [Deltaproteobacteria bacterium]
MGEDIVLDVLGNTGCFSLEGESSGYMLTFNGSRYLLECGSPVFATLGHHGIEEIKGIFATHSHEDHRRWFTDIALFRFYDARSSQKLKLISTETILEEFHKNSKGALERSLSEDSKRVIDIPYHEMVEECIIGPRSLYRIRLEESPDGGYRYVIRDRDGSLVGPEKAKIFINPRANRPRMLFKDDESGLWVEPESYYPFSSTEFYEVTANEFVDEEARLRVKAVKAPVWHGVPSVAFRFMTERNSLFFSSDTVYKPSLWKELCETRRPQNFDRVNRREFEGSAVIYGDINDFIELTWSRERYEAALSAYKGSVVIHDVARKNSVVHTDYEDIGKAPIEKLIFTHTPDNLTALRPILKSGKRIVIRDGEAHESVRGMLYPLDADVYVKHFSGYWVGYASPEGAYKVIEEGGLLGVVSVETPGDPLIRVDLYCDIDGEYYPPPRDPRGIYRTRPDGKVEEVVYGKKKSTGRVVQGMRNRLSRVAGTESSRSPTIALR